MADKKKKTLGEYIQVEMAKGVPVTIERKGMSDEEWAKVKKTARDSGKLVEDTAPLEPEAISSDEQERVRKMGLRMEKNRREQFDKENPDFKDLELETKREPGMSVRGQMQRLATGAAPQGRNSAQGHERTRMMPELDLSGRSPHDDGTRRMPEMDISPTNEITQEDVDAFETKKALEKSVKDNEAAAQMEEGLDFTTPESRLAAVARKRAGELPSFEQVTEDGTPAISPTITDNNDTSVVKANKPLQFGKDAVTMAAAGEGGVQNPASGEQPINFDGGMGDGVNPLARVLLPQTTALENYVPGSSPDGGTPAPAAPGTTPPAPGVAGTSPKAPGPGGSVSVKASSTTPGAVPPLATNDPYAADRKAMESAAQLHKDANTKLAETQLHEEEQKSKILNDKILFTAENEKQRIAAVNSYDETLRHGEQTMNSISDERRALMNQKVDPDAYYTKGGVGRGVLATISGALFGFTGQGMQFLQRMDNLAQQEVKNQQDELARKSDQLGLIAGDKRNVIAMARERGMNSVQSIAAAKVSFYESVQDQLAKAVADNPQFAAIALEKNAMIEQSKAKESMLLTQATQHDAHARVAEQQRWAQINMQKRALEIKAAAGAGGKGLKIPPKTQNTIANATKGLRLIPALEKAVGNAEGSYLVAIKDEIAKQFPGSDANNRDIEAAFLNRNIFAGIDESVIQNADQQFLAKIQASPGISGLRLPGAVGALRRMLRETRDAHIKTARELGQSVEGIEPTGEEVDPEFPEIDL
jgi:hypothetical protein